MAECIFCRIIAREIPAEITYEDDLVVAFRDIHPVAPVHILIVPRRHVENLAETGEEDQAWLGRIQVAAAILARREGIGASGFRVVANCGPEAGQEVPHLHYHLIGGKTLGGMA